MLSSSIGGMTGRFQDGMAIALGGGRIPDLLGFNAGLMSTARVPGPLGVPGASCPAGGRPPQGRRLPELTVRYGDRGERVSRLQAFLNSRLNPSPRLKVDGRFGKKTLAAVRRLQWGRSAGGEDVVGRAAWRKLVFINSRRRPAENVIDWPLARKFDEMALRLLHRLPAEVRTRLRGAVSLQVLGSSFARIAVTSLFGPGELIGLGILLILGEQVACELAEAIVNTALAMTAQDLDDAADRAAWAFATPGSIETFLARFSSRLESAAPSDQISGPPPAAVTTPVRTAKPASQPAPEPEPNTFANTHDAEAQAASLEQAAALGSPFCEECQKLARAKAMPAPVVALVPDTYGKNHDAQQQADSLKAAAAEGAPFCEECQQLKKAA